MVARGTKRTPNKKSTNGDAASMTTSSTSRKLTKAEKAKARARAAEAMGRGREKATKMTPVKKEAGTDASNSNMAKAINTTKESKDVTPKNQGVNRQETIEDVEQRDEKLSAELIVEGKQKEGTSAILVLNQLEGTMTNPIIKKEYSGLSQILMVDLQSNSFSTVADGFWNLFGYIKDGNVEEADMLGAASSMILALGKWKKISEVQYYGCQAIRVYARQSFSGKATLLKHGGIESIALAMKSFPRDCGLQVEACRALLELASTKTPIGDISNAVQFSLTSSDQLEVWSPFVFDYNGIGLIVYALNKFQDKPDVLANCASFLHLLLLLSERAKLEEVKNVIRSSGAQKIVFGSMQTHFKHSSLSHAGRKLIRYF